MLALKDGDEQFERFLKKTRAPGFFKDPREVNNLTHSIAPPILPERSMSARIFPNGEFGVGFIPHRGISAQDRRYERDCRYARDNAEIELDVQISPDGEVIHYGRKIIPGQPPPKLGIGSKSSRPGKRYGLKGITSYGRKMLRNAGHLIDKASENQYNRLPQMGTLTVPSYHPDTMRLICAHWGDIVRKFFQECKRLYAKYCYRFDYASCTEIQPKRWVERGEVGLHIHFLFVAIRLGKGRWVMGDEWVRATWGRILGHYLGVGDNPQRPNYRRDTVRQSSAAYLAKYASKGCSQVAEVAETMGVEWLPGQWWSISSGLRESIRRYTILSTGELAEKLLVISRWGVSDYIRYIRCITLPINTNDYAKARGCPQEVVLGYGGLLTACGFELFAPGDYFKDIGKMLPRTIPYKPRRSQLSLKLLLTTPPVTS